MPLVPLFGREALVGESVRWGADADSLLVSRPNLVSSWVSSGGHSLTAHRPHRTRNDAFRLFCPKLNLIEGDSCGD